MADLTGIPNGQVGSVRHAAPRRTALLTRPVPTGKRATVTTAAASRSIRRAAGLSRGHSAAALGPNRDSLPVASAC